MFDKKVKKVIKGMSDVKYLQKTATFFPESDQGLPTVLDNRTAVAASANAQGYSTEIFYSNRAAVEKGMYGMYPL